MTFLILVKVVLFMLGLVLSGMTLDSIITDVIKSCQFQDSFFYFPVSRFLFAVTAWVIFYALNIITF